MKSKNVTTLTRAMNHPHKISTTSTLSTDIESQLGASNSDLSRKSSGDGVGKLRRSIRALKRGSGIEAVKDLWQQTGIIFWPSYYSKLNLIKIGIQQNSFVSRLKLNPVVFFIDVRLRHT